MFENLTRHELRPICPMGIWTISGFQMKIYGIAYQRQEPRTELVEAARRVAELYLAKPTRNRTHGVGFIGIHDGRGENQIFVDRWINENELLHKVWASPVDHPEDVFETPEDFNSVCIWDLKVQCFERESWLRHVLDNPAGPNPKAYLDDCLSGRH